MRLFSVLGLVMVFFLGLISEGVALPPAEEIPEEVLRTEIIVEGRSPLNNEPLSAQEYAQLQQSLRESPYAPVLNENVRDTIFLLQLLKMFRTFNPL